MPINPESFICERLFLYIYIYRNIEIFKNKPSQVCLCKIVDISDVFPYSYLGIRNTFCIFPDSL